MSWKFSWTENRWSWRGGRGGSGLREGVRLVARAASSRQSSRNWAIQARKRLKALEQISHLKPFWLLKMSKVPKKRRKREVNLNKVKINRLARIFGRVMKKRVRGFKKNREIAFRRIACRVTPSQAPVSTHNFQRPLRALPRSKNLSPKSTIILASWVRISRPIGRRGPARSTTATSLLKNPLHSSWVIRAGHLWRSREGIKPIPPKNTNK